MKRAALLLAYLIILVALFMALGVNLMAGLAANAKLDYLIEKSFEQNI